MIKVTEIDRARVYPADTHEPHDIRWVLIWTGADGWTRSFLGSWLWRTSNPTHWREQLDAP